MSHESDFHAHYLCTWCHGLKAKADIIFVDDKPICAIGGCKDAYYRKTRPSARRFTADDDGQC